jgi:hypothetical protein
MPKKQREQLSVEQKVSEASALDVPQKDIHLNFLLPSKTAQQYETEIGICKHMIDILEKRIEDYKKNEELFKENEQKLRCLVEEYKSKVEHLTLENEALKLQMQEMSQKVNCLEKMITRISDRDHEYEIIQAQCDVFLYFMNKEVKTMKSPLFRSYDDICSCLSSYVKYLEKLEIAEDDEERKAIDLPDNTKEGIEFLKGHFKTRSILFDYILDVYRAKQERNIRVHFFKPSEPLEVKRKKLLPVVEEVNKTSFRIMVDALLC